MGKFVKLIRSMPIALMLLVSFAVSALAADPDGAALYKKQCSMCHGAEGKGFAVMKTPDFTDAKWQDNHKDDAALVTFIRTGKKPMPPFPPEKLSDEEVKAVLAHIRSFKKKKE